MKNGRLVGMVAAALLGAVVLHMQGAGAQTNPEKAKSYKVTFTAAFDPFSGANLPVTVLGGVNGSTPEQSTTEDFDWTQATLNLKTGTAAKGAQIALSGKGFMPSAHVALQLTLRTTNLATNPGNVFTFEDQTIICGTTAGDTCGHYFAPDLKGKITKQGKMPLSTCMADNGLPAALAAGNIEVLDAFLIDCTDGKVFGVPGLIQANPGS